MIKQIKAKYDSNCASCGRPVNKGDTVLWQRGQRGVIHHAPLDCAAIINAEHKLKFQAELEGVEDTDYRNYKDLQSAEAHQGMNDVNLWREDRALFGDAVAAQMQLAREYQYEY
tara:strand:+ start:522 stop:863 length:342 start_codon:yes stop_codon:yes gene_type:complete